jgi:hypothetical protein
VREDELALYTQVIQTIVKHLKQNEDDDMATWLVDNREAFWSWSFLLAKECDSKGIKPR